MLPYKSQQAGGLGHTREDHPAAFTFGNELTSPLPSSHRPVLIVSDLEKAVVLLPFAKILLPSRRKKPELALHEAADTALTVDPLLKLNGGIAVQLPKEGGVGDKRPNRRWRLGESMLAAIAVDGAALCRHAALRIAPRAANCRAKVDFPPPAFPNTAARFMACCTTTPKSARLLGAANGETRIEQSRMGARPRSGQPR